HTPTSLPPLPYTTLFRSPPGGRGGHRRPVPAAAHALPARAVGDPGPAHERVERACVLPRAGTGAEPQPALRPAPGPDLPRPGRLQKRQRCARPRHGRRDRKSTRLNSSHVSISYAVFCLKKKKKHKQDNSHTTTQH